MYQHELHPHEPAKIQVNCLPKYFLSAQSLHVTRKEARSIVRTTSPTVQNGRTRFRPGTTLVLVLPATTLIMCWESLTYQKQHLSCPFWMGHHSTCTFPATIKFHPAMTGHQKISSWDMANSTVLRYLCASICANATGLHMYPCKYVHLNLEVQHTLEASNLPNQRLPIWAIAALLEPSVLSLSPFFVRMHPNASRTAYPPSFDSEPFWCRSLSLDGIRGTNPSWCQLSLRMKFYVA